ESVGARVLRSDPEAVPLVGQFPDDRRRARTGSANVRRISRGGRGRPGVEEGGGAERLSSEAHAQSAVTAATDRGGVEALSGAVPRAEIPQAALAVPERNPDRERPGRRHCGRGEVRRLVHALEDPQVAVLVAAGGHARTGTRGVVPG